MDNARPLNHFSIELPFTRDNARGVMDLSFFLCKGRKGKKEEEEEEKGEREEGGRGRQGNWLDLCKVRRIHFASQESDASSKGTNPADCI